LVRCPFLLPCAAARAATVADTSPVRRRFATSKALSIAGHLVEAGATAEGDTAPTEAATAVVAMVEAETAVNTAAVATVEAATAAGPVGTAVASLKGPAAPISAATGNESVPASMARRRLSGSHA
jgi:hypothetical protein